MRAGSDGCQAQRAKEARVRKIVVGVDGSQGAGEALRFAVSEAAVRHLPVRVVTAWQVPATPVAGGIVPAIAIGDFEEAAKELVELAVARAARLDPDVDCSGEVVHGRAGDVLVDSVGSDDLLVVGSRGRGGVAGLLLGSVSRQVVHDACCPVVVVRARKEARRDGRRATASVEP
jgi:nucleotide-binding universal stress UspA family protein